MMIKLKEILKDKKNVFIIILSMCLIISFFIGSKLSKDNTKGEIDDLHNKNKVITNRIDSLKLVNTSLNEKLKSIDIELSNKKSELDNAELQIITLKKQLNEISTIVNNMSANNVASELSSFIDKRTKSKNNHK